MNHLSQQIIDVYESDLPLTCSGPKHESWNGHPRIFLPIQSDSIFECPYCSTQYKLINVNSN